jgi:hypothetical protein
MLHVLALRVVEWVNLYLLEHASKELDARLRTSGMTDKVFGSFVFKLETPWIPGSSPRMTILNGCFCLSFPQVLSGNPVSLMSISTFLRMNIFFLDFFQHIATASSWHPNAKNYHIDFL